MMERWGVNPEEMSDEKNFVEEEEPQEEFDLVRLIKLVAIVSSKPWSKLLTYDRNFNAENLINWINTLGKYLDYE